MDLEWKFPDILKPDKFNDVEVTDTQPPWKTNILNRIPRR